MRSWRQSNEMASFAAASWSAYRCVADPGQRCFTGACCAFGMGMERMRAHLDEHAGPVLDVFAQQFDREVFGLDEEGIATLRALGAMRASSHSGQWTCRWSARACATAFSWVSRSRMASLKGRSHEKYTVSIPANNGVMRSAFSRHRSISLLGLLSTHVSVEGRETQSALWPAIDSLPIARWSELLQRNAWSSG